MNATQTILTNPHGITFAYTISESYPVHSPTVGNMRDGMRYTLDGRVLSLWETYSTNGRAIGQIKRLAKKKSGWPKNTEWVVSEGSLFVCKS